MTKARFNKWPSLKQIQVLLCEQNMHTSSTLSSYVPLDLCCVCLVSFWWNLKWCSHQGTNYYFKDCLVSSIFYGRYGMEGHSHTEAPLLPDHPFRGSLTQYQECHFTLVLIIRLLWSCFRSYIKSKGLKQAIHARKADSIQNIQSLMLSLLRPRTQMQSIGCSSGLIFNNKEYK